MLNHDRFTTKDYIVCAVFIALTCILTMIIQIPVIGTHGYVNMGDSVILFTALYLGKKHGFIIGSIGSALADIVSGYAIYFPITFIAKGLEGFICGLFSSKSSNFWTKLISSVFGGMTMVFCYFVGEIFIFGIKPAMIAIPSNIIQALFGIGISLMIFYSIKKIKIS